RRIAARATIVLDGFRSGVAERLGLGAGALHAVNPDLVYVSASGYGHGGPDGHRPAYAPSIGAAAGLARANVGDTVAGAPDLTAADILDGHIRLFSASAVTSAQADGFAALGVATAMLLGLLARERGGDGQTISSTTVAGCPCPGRDPTCAARRRGIACTTPPTVGSSWPHRPSATGRRSSGRCDPTCSSTTTIGSPRSAPGRST